MTAAAAPPGPAAAALGWSDALAIGDPGFDRTHREFVDLIQALDRADAAAMPAAVAAAIEHTEAHFRRETTLMPQCTAFRRSTATTANTRRSSR